MDPADTPNATTVAYHAGMNLSVFADLRQSAFLAQSLAHLCDAKGMVLISDSADLAGWIGPARQIPFAEVAATDNPIRYDRVQQRINDLTRTDALVLIDMSWWLDSVHSAANLEGWAQVCDHLTGGDRTLVSIYDTNLLIPDQFLAAMRGHAHFLAPSGLYSNPLWIPPKVARNGTLTDQMAHLLGQIVPDYRNADLRISDDRDAASGADPKWATTAKWAQPRLSGSTGWKVCCLGRLRVYTGNGDQLRWDIPGGAPKKSRALFAFLLHRGDRGARASELAELLWPDEPDEDTKRKRLHHAIAMLRRTLGAKEHVRRMGEYYALVPPANTWIDITSFEQLCNRAKFMAEEAQDDRAMAVLDAADRLYAGDLFEDLGAEFIETDVDDWVMPRRVWLREMAIKVHMYKAQIHHRSGHLREALESCQTALAMDPLSEAAHAQAMQILHDQGRRQAVTRQYRQYLSSLAQIDAGEDGSDLAELYARLMKTA